jgi:3-methyladenine DNA glycosylase AlkD
VESATTLVGLREEVDVLAAEIRRQLTLVSPFTTANIRLVRREFSKRIMLLPPKTVIDLALCLLDNQNAPRWFGYELVQHHQAAAKSLNARSLEHLGKGIASWDAVDTFACFLSGPSWREHQVPDSLIIRWARSKDRWWRRAALVSTVALNNKARGGRGDTERTLMICSLLVDDRDDMVVKAMSWTLRELTKRDVAAVKKFVAQNRQRLAARVLREVTNKLTTGLKNPQTS